MLDPTKQPIMHDTQAERQIIAAVLCNNDLLDNVGLSSDHFVDHVCKRIWLACENVLERGSRADEITAGALLGPVDRDEMANMLEERGDPSAIPSYVKLLKASRKRRELIAQGGGLPLAAADLSVDPDEIISALEERLYELRDPVSGRRCELAGDAAERVVDLALEAKRKGVPPGFPTHIPKLDAILNPMQKGQSITIGAGTSAGKTALGCDIAARNAERGVHVSFLSLEMNNDEIVRRLIARETGIAVADITIGNLSEDEIERVQAAAAKIKRQWPLRIEMLAHVTPGRLHRVFQSHIRRFKSEIFIVDYLQLVSGRGKDLNEQTSDVTRNLKLSAGDLDVVTIALSQLNRGFENRSEESQEG